ncbi:sensor histidine kinase [Rhodopirellula sp. P2]|uniref:sensor histidine kinase n=1 Tax=Rhodopirellula sp. P2 TaxID=2127060 RepID=UPI002368B6B1|nr:HAMP domain-containing sensor histidine kinase [Rhodopirellula sp. P2]WDQ15366.1 HAMP domain-containing sensor histidine kinase [Rhodopirellula sp. P2]
MSSADLFAGWLPPIVIQDDEGTANPTHEERIWLPMRSSSSATLLHALVSCDTSATFRRKLRNTLHHDPALCLFTAAKLVQEHERGWRPIAGRWTTKQLGDWWIRHGSEVWDGAAFLSCPDTESGEQQLQRFMRLDQHFQTLPFSRWLMESDLWWKAAGLHRRASICQSMHSIRLIDSDREDSSSIPNKHPSNQDAHEAFGKVTAMVVERERLQSEFSESLETVRRDLAKQLAYGLSHEINNPLANIATRAQGLIASAAGPQQAESLQRIVDQSYRAHAMIADLMFYAHPPEPQMASGFAAKQVVNDLIAPMRSTLQRDEIVVDIHIPSSLKCDGDPAMLSEAIRALIHNAVESIGVDGKIVLSMEADKDAKRCLFRLSDSGQGLTPEDAARAFDPYFSGREAGRGLGLSLCRVHRIAELHGGTIQLHPALIGCVAELTWPLHVG